MREEMFSRETMLVGQEGMERLRQQGNTVETLRLERGRAAA